MKRFNRTLIKGTNWLLGGLLTLLGFGGCNINDIGVVEYGAPHAAYVFRGKVTNGAGDPIPNIKIEVQALFHSANNPVLSNAEGFYSVATNGFENSFELAFVDIDGEANGSYQNDTISVKIEKGDYIKDGKNSWDYGSVIKDVNVVLREKAKSSSF